MKEEKTMFDSNVTLDKVSLDATTASKGFGFIVQRRSVALARGQGRRVDRMVWEVFDAGEVPATVEVVGQVVMDDLPQAGDLAGLDMPPEVFCPDFVYAGNVDPANAEPRCENCHHSLCDGVCELGDDDETADYHLLEIPDCRGSDGAGL